MEKLFTVSLYVLVLGGVFALIVYSLNRNIIQIAARQQTGSKKENYYIVKDFMTEKEMKTDVVVHTGTAILYHRNKKTLFINETAARGKNLYLLGSCLHEAGEALAREKSGLLYMLKTYLTMLIRGATMLVPAALLIWLITRKEVLLYASVFVLAINILYSLLLIPGEYVISRSLKKYVRELDMSEQNRNLLDTLLDSHIFSASVSVFKSFANIFNYVSGLSKGMEEARVANYEKAIDEAAEKRKRKLKDK